MNEDKIIEALGYDPLSIDIIAEIDMVIYMALQRMEWG